MDNVNKQQKKAGVDMNYIAEINSFNEFLVENPLNGNEQALWYRLMAYANKFRLEK